LRDNGLMSLEPQSPDRLWGRRSQRDHSSRWIGCPGLFAGHKGTERHDRYECKVLCEQRRNLLRLPKEG